MRILFNRQVNESICFWTTHTERRDGSDDGWIRPGRAYEVDMIYELHFENEIKEARGYSYDFSITRKVRGYSYDYPRVDSGSSDLLRENFHLIAGALKENGIIMLDYPAYMRVKIVHRGWGISFEIDFKGEIKPITEGDPVISAPDLLSHLKEEDGEWKQMKIGRAIGDYTIYKDEYHVSLDSIPDELFRKKEIIRLEPVFARDLLERGVVSEADVAQALEAFAGRAKNGGCNRISTDGIEDIVLGLPDELRKGVAQLSQQSSGNLQMLRDCCPERIDWDSVKAEDYLDSDLDIMVRATGRVFTDTEREFINRCLEKPELRRKVYDCLASAREVMVDRVAFTLRVGLLVGVAEEELVQMVLNKQERLGFELDDRSLRAVYQEFSFTPGLAWVKAANDRREVERQRREEERRRREMEDTEDNERVVRFVQESGKLSVRVRKQHGSSRIESPDGKVIGYLQSSEQRVMLVEGLKYWYLINVERVKKLRNGVLHFDVLDDDARWVIGPKGSHIKGITEELNERGCELKVIKVHTHAADEV